MTNPNLREFYDRYIAEAGFVPDLHWVLTNLIIDDERGECDE